MQFLVQLLLCFILFSSCKGSETVAHIDLKKHAWYNQYTKDTVDALGNHYIAGKYDSDTLLIGTIQLVNPNKENGTSIYIAKFDSTGKVLWAQTAGGDSYDDVNDICFDSKGNLIITGDFRSIKFRMFGCKTDALGRDYIGFKNMNSTTSNDGDVFIAKYDSKGVLTWAKQCGGGRSDIGWTIKSNSNNEIIVDGTCISDTLFFLNNLEKPHFLVRNGATYESLNFRVTYTADGVLKNMVEKDAGAKLFNKKFNDFFTKCLNDFKIKITCAACTGVYFNFNLSIDSTGKMKEIKLMRSRFCNEKTKEAFEKKLNEFLNTYDFPDELKGKTFDFNLNRVLKC